jgi:signal transduction histidine kinase
MRGKGKPLCFIALLSLLAVILYYLGDLSWLGSSQLEGGFFASQAYHELCLLAFIGPVIWAAFTFRIRGGVVVSISESLAILPHSFYFSPYSDPLFRLAAFTIISMLLAALIGRELNNKDELQKHQSRLGRLLSQTMDTQEREKRYLARELHDESAQALVDISHEIDELLEANRTASTSSKDKLRQLRSDVETVLKGTRRFIRGLRPPLLEELGLGPSLKWLAEELTDELGIEVSTDLPEREQRLPELQEQNVFRIAQEALTNAKRHSQASKICLSLALSDDKVHLRIEDNGVGFGMPTQDELVAEGRFGLIGIRERARLAGGTVRIESTPGKGTVVTVEMPILRAE